MPMPVWKKEYTDTRAEKLDNLDIPVSSNASPAEVRSEVSAELDSRGATSTRFSNLDNLDASVSSRATPTQVRSEIDSELNERGATATRFAKLDNLDKAISNVDTEVDESLNKAIPDSPTTGSIFERIKTLDDNYTPARAAKLDNLDAAVSSRATPSQVRNEIDAEFTERGATASRFANLDNLDATVSSRATPSQVRSEVSDELDDRGATSSRFAKLDNLDAAISSRQPDVGLTSTHVSRIDATISSRATPSDVNTQVHNRLNTAIPSSPTTGSIYERIKTLDDNYTAARAAKLDNLDASVSSRLSKSDFDSRLSSTRAAKIDNLDVKVSTRSSHTPADVWSYGTRTLTQTKFPFWSAIVLLTAESSLYFPSDGEETLTITPPAGETWLIMLYGRAWMESSDKYHGAYAMGIANNANPFKYTIYSSQNALYFYYRYSAFKLSENLISLKKNNAIQERKPSALPLPEVLEPLRKYTMDRIDPITGDVVEQLIILEENTPLAVDDSGHVIESFSAYISTRNLMNILAQRDDPSKRPDTILEAPPKYRGRRMRELTASEFEEVTGHKKYLDKWRKEGINI